MATDQKEALTPEQAEQVIGEHLLSAQVHLMRASVLRLALIAEQTERARWQLMAQQVAQTGELSEVQQQLSGETLELVDFAHGKLTSRLSGCFAGPAVDR